MSFIFYLVIGVFVFLWIMQSVQRGNRRLTARRKGWLGMSRQAGLERKIIARCNWDETAKDRIIRATQARFPDKDELWVLEKVLFDLERDYR